MHRRYAALPLLALLPLAACSGQTGSEREGAMAGTRCVVERTEELGLSEASPLGFSASEALATMAEPPTSLHWDREDADTELTLSVSARGDVARFEHNVESSSDSGPEIASTCVDDLRVPVTVAIRTGDGRLDEVFDADLVATSATEASVTVPIELGSLQSTYDFSELIGKNETLLGLSLSVEARDGAVSGSLHVHVRETDGQGQDTVEGFLPIAFF